MTASRYFHEGEVALQAEDGVDTAALETLAPQVMHPQLSDTEIRFVNERTFSVATSIDTQGRPWSSPLFGAHRQPLFVVQDSTSVTVRPQRANGDPLFDNVAATGELGVLYFDPSRRRRAKSLGNARVVADGTIDYRMHREFGICNKYIFKRTHEPAATQATPSSHTESHQHLDTASVTQLTNADTVFLASAHVINGADATHRGGPPGFVSVADNSTISIPDYSGNGLFNTLGNIRIDNRVGLMSVDFDTGRTMQLTGRGTIQSSPADDPMSRRTLVIEIEHVLISHHQHGQWTDIEAFDHRPGLKNPGTPYLNP